MKKTVIFLFSGQSRSNPLSHNNNKCEEILSAYSALIFTEEFKQKFDYKIYISTDDIHLINVINYFGPDRIGNIHLYDTGYYYKDVQNVTQPVEYYLQSYDNHPKQFISYPNSVRQHHKILDSFNLFLNDKDNFSSVDYIVRLRLDIKFFSPNVVFNMVHRTLYTLCDYLETLEHTKVQVLMHWDFFAVGKYDIMKAYCTGLDNNYGKFILGENIDGPPAICLDYFLLDRNVWTYAPETQLFETLFHFCKENNLTINECIKPINFCEIVRA
jgi:hypothetical protein